MPQKLTQMQIDRVSLVDKGANQRQFAILKRAAAPELGNTYVVNTGTGVGQAWAGGFIASIAKGVADLIGIANPRTEDNTMPPEPVAKATRTFNDMRASAELNDELPEAFQILQDSIWNAMWAYGDDDQPLPIEQRKALVATNLDQFKAFALALIDAGMAKRDSKGTSTAVLAIEGIVAKVGRKISAARLTRLKEAASALSAVLAEVETADDTATEKRASAEEEVMTPEELTAAITKGNEPLVARIEALEKNAAAPPAPEPAAASAAEPPAEGSQPATLDDVLTAVSKLADRVEEVEKTPGQQTSIPGQDTQVKKGTGWGNVFGIGH